MALKHGSKRETRNKKSASRDPGDVIRSRAGGAPQPPAQRPGRAEPLPPPNRERRAAEMEMSPEDENVNAPTLRADRIMGHAAQQQEHSRGTPGRERPAGSKVRQSRTEPPQHAKQQRRSPRSGARPR